MRKQSLHYCSVQPKMCEISRIMKKKSFVHLPVQASSRGVHVLSSWQTENTERPGVINLYPGRHSKYTLSPGLKSDFVTFGLIELYFGRWSQASRNKRTRTRKWSIWSLSPTGVIQNKWKDPWQDFKWFFHASTQVVTAAEDGPCLFSVAPY